jgi:REP element-mobilizing transposase RayT
MKKKPGQQKLRKGRCSIEGGYYFVTLCTKNGEVLLNTEKIASVIFNSINWLEQHKRLHLICCMIMPDHMHLVFVLGQGQTLTSIMHSFKSYTSKEIDKTLGQSGGVWQAQYYDHGIRREENLDEIIRYCYENPVRAGLVKSAEDYPYWWCKYEL